MNAVRDISGKTHNGCRKGNLIENLKNTKVLISNFDNALDNLLNNGYLIDEDDVLKITGNH